MHAFKIKIEHGKYSRVFEMPSNKVTWASLSKKIQELLLLQRPPIGVVYHHWHDGMVIASTNEEIAAMVKDRRQHYSPKCLFHLEVVTAEDEQVPQPSPSNVVAQTSKDPVASTATCAHVAAPSTVHIHIHDERTTVVRGNATPAASGEVADQSPVDAQITELTRQFVRTLQWNPELNTEARPLLHQTMLTVEQRIEEIMQRMQRELVHFYNNNATTTTAAAAASPASPRSAAGNSTSSSDADWEK
ncbi:hypothetical protein SYNPS1DRAFT_30143 [Syncephalis pseudoplumigaleata]|uniref:PB1 domain-containing protein n=1 Tax=Syncephalis pseudoplumigaleata TaxID=1712513 RepID=A0A4P9YXN5_9FUNG|nr:hypothetical protein SYNPS1DRAFT_30143 [Syncephalis pseudoplumigaleata]|eukprot:RKP24091.1 hypothetical protein SYNPS1DRAFT_30143 [Syncephalis pseudoplumigaleata]